MAGYEGYGSQPTGLLEFGRQIGVTLFNGVSKVPGVGPMVVEATGNDLVTRRIREDAEAKLRRMHFEREALQDSDDIEGLRQRVRIASGVLAVTDDVEVAPDNLQSAIEGLHELWEAERTDREEFVRDVVRQRGPSEGS